MFTIKQIKTLILAICLTALLFVMLSMWDNGSAQSLLTENSGDIVQEVAFDVGYQEDENSGKLTDEKDIENETIDTDKKGDESEQQVEEPADIVLLEVTNVVLIEATPLKVPDTITVNVKLYNNASEGFNKADGEEYLKDIYKYLKANAPDGMFYSAALAMSYTEGGAGKKGVYTRTNNCFGIRAGNGWDGYVYARSTGQVYKDYATSQKYGATDLFRAYNSMEDSVKDYIRLISGSRYYGALETDSPKEYLRYVLSKGYGESGLLDMWIGVINNYNLTQYDQ